MQEGFLVSTPSPAFILFYLILIICLWLHWALIAEILLSLSAVSGGYSLVSLSRLLIVVAFGCKTQALEHQASVVEVVVV